MNVLLVELKGSLRRVVKISFLLSPLNFKLPYKLFNTYENIKKNKYGEELLFLDY